MRIIALLFIFLILASLVRVGLSLTLFLLLMAGYYFGVVPQNGLR
jgi:hypothetical protein